MLKSLALAGALLCAFTISSEARERHKTYAADPSCNLPGPNSMPCQDVGPSARGERVVKSMGGFGSAQKVYTPRSAGQFAKNAKKSGRAEQATHSNGLVRSASGATAHVAPHAAGAFQCLVTALDNAGYPVRFMGGWRARGSVRGSLHPAGLALDINQVSRNVTTPRMPANEIALAKGCGLISGAQWSHGDSGHFQLGGWAGRHRHYAGRRPHYASAR